MIWLWQVFRWSILAITRHGHCAPHSCCHWDGETRTGDHNWDRSGSLVTLLTKNSHNKLSARLSTSPRVWVTAPGAPPPSCQSPHCCKSVQFSCGGCLSSLPLGDVGDAPLLSALLRSSDGSCSALSCGEMPADDRSQCPVITHQSSLISWSAHQLILSSSLQPLQSQFLFMTAMASCWPECHTNRCSLVVSILTCVSLDPCQRETVTLFKLLRQLYSV